MCVCDCEYKNGNFVCVRMRRTIKIRTFSLRNTCFRAYGVQCAAIRRLLPSGTDGLRVSPSSLVLTYCLPIRKRIRIRQGRWHPRVLKGITYCTLKYDRSRVRVGE